MNEIHTNVKKFVFQSKPSSLLLFDSDEVGEDSEPLDTLEVIVPERMEASYGLYVWPSAPVLSWYLFLNRKFLVGKKVLELGAGTALPGVVSALCGAQVILSDSIKLPHCLDQCRKTVQANGLEDRVSVVGITWGLFLQDVIDLRGKVDIILGSDCFFDPVVFEDLVATIAFLLGDNKKAKFLGTYQERSSDWSIAPLLKKWSLHCKHIPLSDLANSCKVDLVQLMQDHTIHLLEITLLD